MENIVSTSIGSPTITKRQSNRFMAYRLAVQIGLFAWATLIASWGSVKLVAAPVLLLGICCTLRSLNLLNRLTKWISWTSSLVIFARLFGTTGSYSIDPYYVEFCTIVTVALCLTWLANASAQASQSCRWLTACWAGVGAIIWLCFGYCYNFNGPFFAALVICIALLIVLKKLVALPGWGHQFANTLILLMIVVPVTDWFTRPKYHLDVDTALRERYYSCEAAKADPVAFKEWWYYYMSQWNGMGGSVYMKDPAGALAFRLKPGSEGHLFHSTIHINSLGFRGKEFSKEKGDTYRIFAMGESTTYGCTLEPNDQTWPEVLEQMIKDRIKPSRPVEVINAGVPSYSILDTLYRLRTEILAYKPDMIICYHGVNGFGLLQDGLPPVVGKTPPRFEQRPIRLLADCEYSIKVIKYRRHHTGQPVLRPVSKGDALKSRYAQAYCELIDFAHTNNVRLTVANFAMAVNEQSKSDVAKFYDMTFPVYPAVKANVAHTMILEYLTHEHPEVGYVDTHRHLDGEHEKFIDEVHLTQAGRNQLAENMYAGIEKTLRADLSRLESKTASK